MLTADGNFETFSIPHIAAISIIAIVAIILLLIAQTAKSAKINLAATVIAVLLIANEFVFYAVLISTSG